MLFVLFLKCFSHPWDKLQRSPAASTAPLLSHRDQNPWVLMLHTGVSGTRGCVSHWPSFPASLGPSPSMDTAVFPVPAAHTHCSHSWQPPGTCCLPVGRSRRGNNHSATIFWAVTSDSQTGGMDAKSVHIHQHRLIFTICISDLHKELGEAFLSSAESRRGERNGMGSQSDSDQWPLQCAGRGCVRGIAKCYSEWE